MRSEFEIPEIMLPEIMFPDLMRIPSITINSFKPTHDLYNNFEKNCSKTQIIICVCVNFHCGNTFYSALEQQLVSIQKFVNWC